MSPVPVWSEDHENTYQMDRNEDAEADKCMGDFILIIARILHIPVLQRSGKNDYGYNTWLNFSP